MSLVNDALKRATEAQKKISSEPPKLPLRPAMPPQEAPRGFGLAWPLSLVLFISMICVLAWFNRQDHSMQVQARTPASKANVKGSADANQTSASAQPIVPGKAGVAAGSQLTNPPVPVIEPVAAKLPPLKLQAVFFNPQHPSAVIEGKTVFVGDSVRDLKVVAIASKSALLISATETNLLTLE
jgi:hypothetical protein